MGERARFEDRVYLVAGGSRGIGRACARALGAEGGRVVVAGWRGARLDEVVGQIRASGGQAEAVLGDVREEATCGSWVETAVRRFGGLDGFVNAAGVMGSGGLLATEPAEWDRMMDTNLRSMFLLTRAAAPELMKRRGAVVNLSSVAGPRPYANLIAYVVSKAGVDAFTAARP
jgi:3-oxoacyl-[acyl-carrier protein] reductase